MTICFANLNSNLQKGMREFTSFYGIKICDDGIKIFIKVNKNKKIKIVRHENSVCFEVDREYQVFRSLSILQEMYDKGIFEYSEECYFETCGVMFDGSQAGSLINVDSFKRLLIIMSAMGYNMAMLYCEDCFELKNEPYWGNMRPRYSQQDFRDIDDFAYSLGIEMIPSVQTLGHLPEAIKRPPYQKISDMSSVLMVGEDEVYTLIEKIISQVSSCFRSKRIHIGLDEAWGLGLGNYLRKNGYHTQTELMRQHIKRVNEIATKYELDPIMWADMYFRAKSKIGEYHDNDVNFDDTDKELVPENMGLMYWDYYHETVEDYEEYIEKHLKLSNKIMFAGCARNVRTFASHYTRTENTTNPALIACKNKHIKFVLATVWGDDHRESSNFAVLPELMLFAEHMYASVPEKKRIIERFKYCTKADWSAFADIDALDAVPEFNGNNRANISLTRIGIWQDIMLGLCDSDLHEFDFSAHYGRLKEKLLLHSKKYTDYKKIFEFYYYVATVMEQKMSLGIKLEKAYTEKNITELNNIAKNILPKLYDNMVLLRKYHRNYFFDEYKPIGWEILDIRYGGAIMRIETAMARLNDYLDGKIEEIEELSEQRLSFSGTDKVRSGLNYTDICSASSL